MKNPVESMTELNIASQQTAPLDHLYTLSETCGYLCCGRKKIAKLRKAGKLTAVISGRNVLITRSSLTEYVSNNREVYNG
ncbi:helix-turn-helix domain-containing protein [Ferruginibacter paludis]|uniref:helix-turn-helix domain-containing protein n=1 Tax=Ferruginibacter paludis TaxID=1310417 RepID=UPI0025B2E8C2|nr:helix-turn-helix domain-containing protein [Ferruginibacter paludis]MDN3657951.1 helix-turn-helix domain-containing protein [Ferruginibacter paludis]